jgi:hypothetical protein
LAGTIMREAPVPCVLRINAGEDRFDPEWTLDYRDVTDGRHGAMFSYIEHGQALISAFYDERTSFDDTTDPWNYVGSNNWRIWSMDLKTETGQPLEGIDFNGASAHSTRRNSDRIVWASTSTIRSNWAPIGSMSMA